ncbi:hypothetical protein ACRAWD_29615 [Caulobacter segnis]
MIKGLAPLATRDGLYLPTESVPDFWDVSEERGVFEARRRRLSA